ncbi:general secretion pathway protein GspK [Psychrobacter frigidicola]|uniref:General secretion pathway protein GspK n=1 Tax=Psychrobacter frigidicola TaxID=45611 RepID=A0A5C7A2L7_9GAMM|nr:type II secretion system minor pseudopilin GspK [Psychrobacter frigidicola]TXD97619.1 general secretion pathway protein GspK [Psychrobacter frigidicola]
MINTADSQRGVALLTILLLVVSITVVAGAMLASQKIAIRRSGLLFNQNQLLQDINAGQQLAITMLRADAKLNDTDSMQDIWAQPLPPYTLGSHSITAELRDEGSRFNINNLYHDGAADSVALDVFQRLLTQLNLEPDIAIAVLDWQDTDSESYKDGGDEAVVYAQQAGNSQSGNSADKTLPNQPFIDIEQLQEVRGVSADVLATLRPYITAVPYYLPINVNTASPVVLAALIKGGTVEQMQALTELRSQQVLESIDNLWQLPQLGALSDEQRQALTPMLAVDSQAFTALITATDNSNMGAARQRYATVLISKTKINTAENSVVSNGNSNTNSTGNSNGNNSTNTNSNEASDSAKEIRVISQRLWAFRPSF